MPRGTWEVYDYLGGAHRFIPLGQLDDRIYCTFSVATATPQSAAATPQQWLYLKTWQQSQEQAAMGEGTDRPEYEPPDSRAGRLLKRLEGYARLTRLAKILIRRWRALIDWHRTRSKSLPYPLVGRF